MYYENCKFPKKIRKQDPKLLKRIRKMPCLVCGRPPPSQACHYSSVGARGDDTEDNVFPACASHHREQHRIGIETFTEKYAAIKRWRKEVEKS